MERSAERFRALFSMLGRAHVLEVLHEMVGNERPRMRFSELKAELEIGQTSLSLALKSLVEAGFLSREEANRPGPHVTYAVTEQALSIRPVFVELTSWFARHQPDRALERERLAALAQTSGDLHAIG